MAIGARTDPSRRAALARSIISFQVIELELTQMDDNLGVQGFHAHSHIVRLTAEDWEDTMDQSTYV